MRAIVTGAAGFIGHRLVTRLVADGHDVRAVDYTAPDLPWRLDAWRTADERLLLDRCPSQRPNFRLALWRLLREVRAGGTHPGLERSPPVLEGLVPRFDPELGCRDVVHSGGGHELLQVTAAAAREIGLVGD